MISVDDQPDVYALLAANIKANGVKHAINAMVFNGKQKYREEFTIVKEVVDNGGTLSAGVERTSLFDIKTISIIRANEEAGRLEEAFKELSKIAKFQRLTKRQMKKSLGMPMVSLVVLVGVVMFLAQGIFSQLAQRDQNNDVFLQAMGTVGAFVRENAWSYPVVMLTVAFILVKLMGSKSVASFVGLFVGKIPVFGSLMNMSQIGTWCRFTSLMARSGIPILEIKESLQSVLNDHNAAAIDKIFVDVGTGKDWSVATSAEGWDKDDERTDLPPLYLSYVNAAGSSGDWDEKMSDAADTFIEEYEAAVESTKPIVEALSLILVALPVGFIVFKLFSNIYGGSNAL
ncbi:MULTISPECIES: type II secretion system F family protein [Pseudoalteromonas]|uniref:type II secretion system F family protein n=1 Tax=Pseudoalteromonas TaxID=53246 RepID=UPI0015836F47|nr:MULTISPECIES: type II secretion system F family protein [Pseudoalteromonas]MDI4652609.1 type II secretion system F family protein [Pseudoalteromonas shioyasakiensis]NUJ38682.1 type II secretion system F family protein [Pseudoalteromonas sp. 0303]